MRIRIPLSYLAIFQAIASALLQKYGLFQFAPVVDAIVVAVGGAGAASLHLAQPRG